MATAPLSPSYRADEFGFCLADLNAKALIEEHDSTSPPSQWRSSWACASVIEGNRFSLGERDGSRSELWAKLWGNPTFNPLSALTHATLQDICRFHATRALATAMMREARAVAEQLGVTFKVSVEQRIAGAEAVGAHKTSMLQDVEHGRALELQALMGSVVELARITGTPTDAGWPAGEAGAAAVAAVAAVVARPPPVPTRPAAGAR